MSLKMIIVTGIFLAQYCIAEESVWPAWPTWPKWEATEWSTWAPWPSQSIVPTPTPKEFGTVAEFLASDEKFSIFSFAAEITGLSESFKSEDFVATILLSTNDVSNEFTQEIFGRDFSPNILSTELFIESVDYYIFPGAAILSTDLKNGQFLKTLLGNVFNIRVDLGKNGDIKFVAQAGLEANVVQADIVAGKSIIHIIDDGLIVKDINFSRERIEAQTRLGITEFSTFDQAINSMQSFSSFGAALKAANVPISGSTIFVPTNTAFQKTLAALNFQSLDELAQNFELLTQILNYHMVDEFVPAIELTSNQKLCTMAGEDLTVNSEGFLTIDGVGSSAKVIYWLKAGEVYIYVIDNVLLPVKVPQSD